MSDIRTPARRLLNSFRTGRALQLWAAALLALIVVAVMALLYGVLAIIFGRHIPGFRIPITVACGVFQIPYRVFAPSVAVSTAVWAGVMLMIGVNYGPRLGELLKAHTYVYFLWGAIVLFLIG